MDRNEQQKIVREAVHDAMRPFVYLFVAAAIITVWLNWILIAWFGISLIKQLARSPTESLILAIVGTVVAIAFAWREIVRSRLLVERGVDTEGIVESISPLRKDELGPVTVTFNVEGRAHTVRKDLIVSEYRVGQVVDVVYDREAPDRCDIYPKPRKTAASLPASVAAGKWVRQKIAKSVTDPKVIFIALVCGTVLICRRMFPDLKLSPNYVVTAALLFTGIALLIVVLIRSIIATSLRGALRQSRLDLQFAVVLLLGAGVGVVAEPSIRQAIDSPPAAIRPKAPTEYQRTMSDPRVQEGLRLMQQYQDRRAQTREADALEKEIGSQKK